LDKIIRFISSDLFTVIRYEMKMNTKEYLSISICKVTSEDGVCLPFRYSSHFNLFNFSRQ